MYRYTIEKLCSQGHWHTHGMTSDHQALIHVLGELLQGGREPHTLRVYDNREGRIVRIRVT